MSEESQGLENENPHIIKKKTGEIILPGGAPIEHFSIKTNKLEEFLKFRPKNSEFSKLDDSSWLMAISIHGLEHQLNHDFMDWAVGNGKHFLSLGSRFNELCPKGTTNYEAAIKKFLKEEHPLGSLGVYDEWFKESGLPIEFRMSVIKETLED